MVVLEAFKRQSLSVQFVVAAAVLLVLSQVVLGGALIARHAHLAREQIKHNALTLAAASIRLSEEAGSDPSGNRYARIARTIAREDAVAYAVLHGPGGEILAQSFDGVDAGAVDKEFTKRGAPLSDTGGVREHVWKPEGFSRVDEVTVAGATGTEIGAIRIGMSLWRTDASVRSGIILWIVLTVILSAAGTVAAYFVSGIILHPLRRLGATGRALGEGNLSQELAIPGRSDEIGLLSTSFYQLNSLLQSSIGQIQQFTDVADRTVADLTSYSENQSSGAREQSASLQQTSGTMEELARASSQIAENAKTVAELADRNFSSMEMIRTNAQDGAEKIIALGEKSKKIGEVVAIIDDITAQTNLLALNASIEAARAGDAGRGFAVVAEEIRKLATNVAGSTEQISRITREIQDASETSVAATEGVARSVEDGIELSKSTAESAVQIHMATQQQKIASDQIVATIKEMVSIARETTTGSQQVAAAADSLALAAKEQREKIGQYEHSQR